MYYSNFLIFLFFSYFLKTVESEDESGYISNDDFIAANKSMEKSQIDEFPFTTHMFPIEDSPKNLPKNIKLETEEEVRRLPVKPYQLSPIYLNPSTSHPIPLKELQDSQELSNSLEHYHKDNNELVEERYNFGSYDFIRKRNNHECRHRNQRRNGLKMESDSNELKDTNELPRLPQILRLNAENPMDGILEQNAIPWMPINLNDNEVIQQNWWVETADPSNDTVITYGQVRRHKI